MNKNIENIKDKPDENVHKGHRARVRQRFITNSLSGFADHEILELLLYYTYPRCDTNPIAHNILKQFGTLHSLLEAGPREIVRRCGISEQTAVLISLIVPMYRKYSESRWEKRAELDDSLKAGQYSITLFSGETTECFYLICLDYQRKLIFPELICRGTINEAQIYPRQIIETVIKHNSMSVILAHNHPSGVLTASGSDINATKVIKSILETINVDIVDHIIVAGDNYYSFSEKRLLDFSYD